MTGEARRFQGDQNFDCSITFEQDLSGGKYAYGFDHGCNVDRGSVFRVREVRTQVSQPILTVYAQWKPNSTTTVRIDLNNIADRAIGYNRAIYAGPRNSAPPQFTEVRRTQSTPSLLLQVRKTF